jgi:hypothetical protein
VYILNTIAVKDEIKNPIMEKGVYILNTIAVKDEIKNPIMELALKKARENYMLNEKKKTKPKPKPKPY